ncbi:Seg-like homing endonuclease protein [Rhizobium phage RHph_X2_25]|nr:Seg-like homing endonuclease protein [Rhizobium phage RHph_X2_25]
MNDFYVYAWLRPCGTPFYIGKGARSRDRDETNRNPFFKRIVAKIRREGGEPSVIRWQDGLREEDAFKLERQYIRLFGRTDGGTGVLCNLTDGGEGQSGAIVGEKTRAKLAASRLGKTHAAETRAKIAKSNSARQVSEETRAKLSSSQLDRTFSEEHRARLTSAQCSRPPLSGFKGVTFDKSLGKWKARIQVNYKTKNLGRFLTAELAAAAYDLAAIEVWGLGNCYLNFPQAANDNKEGASIAS